MITNELCTELYIWTNCIEQPLLHECSPLIASLPNLLNVFCSKKSNGIVFNIVDCRKRHERKCTFRQDIIPW